RPNDGHAAAQVVPLPVAAANAASPLAYACPEQYRDRNLARKSGRPRPSNPAHFAGATMPRGTAARSRAAVREGNRRQHASPADSHAADTAPEPSSLECRLECCDPPRNAARSLARHAPPGDTHQDGRAAVWIWPAKAPATAIVHPHPSTA